LLRSYDIEAVDMSKALKALISATHAKVNRPAVEAGISQLEVGEDFVDAVIAYEGKWIGGETFVSFDKKAISLLKNKINQQSYCEIGLPGGNRTPNPQLRRACAWL
jgi:predicted nucleic-acid-binding protein